MATQDTILFIETLENSLTQGTFHKLALGKPGAGAQGIISGAGRIVDLKSGPHLALSLKSSRNESVTNYPLGDGPKGQLKDALKSLLGPVFRQVDLYTETGSWHLLFNKKNEPKLLKKSLVVTKIPERTHDKQKEKFLDLAAFPWPRELGLVDSQGRPVAAMKDKIHQIEKFLEIVEGLTKTWTLKDFPPERPLKILDLGAGRGYLSFALYQWFTRARGFTVELKGIEIQDHLVEQCNMAAEKSGFTGLQFVKSRIDQIPLGSQDMVVALHACDTATDDALALGMKSKARLIFAAPCCHQELRSQMTTKGGLEEILKFGILWERQAEILTDGLRALVLESWGYKTKVMEFVPAEHSGKNLLIVAELPRDTAPSVPAPVEEAKKSQIAALCVQFGLPRVYLQSLLELEDLGDLKPSWRRLGSVARDLTQKL